MNRKVKLHFLRVRKHWLRAWRYLAFLWNEYNRDRCAQAATSLAFGTLLSIVPLAALLAWLTRPFHTTLAHLLEPLSTLSRQEGLPSPTTTPC